MLHSDRNREKKMELGFLFQRKLQKNRLKNGEKLQIGENSENQRRKSSLEKMRKSGKSE